MKNNNKKVALSGVFIALAMLLSYLESLIPLSNLVTIISLHKLGLRETIIISLGRIILSGILFGNPVVIVYSLAGAAFSIFAMAIGKVIKLFSVVGISVLGGVSHNLGQLVVATIMLENTRVLYYMLVLGISGTIAGIIIGLLAASIMKNIRFHN